VSDNAIYGKFVVNYMFLNVFNGVLMGFNGVSHYPMSAIVNYMVINVLVVQ